jgi:serine/threonine protein kinase
MVFLKVLDAIVHIQTRAHGYHGLQDPQRDSPTARTSSFVGTADFVAPEVRSIQYCGTSVHRLQLRLMQWIVFLQTLHGEAVSYATDLWALGCLTYQLLVGITPFKARTEYLTFQRITACEFTLPEDLSEEAADIIRRLLVLQAPERLGVHVSPESDLLLLHGTDFSDPEDPDDGPYDTIGQQFEVSLFPARRS